MAGVQPRWGAGLQITRTAVEAVTGGQLVEARTAGGGTVGVAAAGSLVVQGVALFDANPSPTTPAGSIVVNPVPKTVTVARNVVIAVTYSASATFGQKLVATANGQVGPAGATPDARTVVGRCEEPGGVGNGAVGLAYIQ